MADTTGQPKAPLPFDAPALARHRDLVARMAASDGEALQLLYLEFSSIVNGIVRRILADPEDAREAVQDTFIRAWRNAATYRPNRGEVTTWLVFIARHAAIDRVRRGARQRLLQQAMAQEPSEPAPMPDPGNSGLRDELVSRMGELSDAQRRALELAFFGGCTQVEIAAAMHQPVGNVKNHLRRGLQRLRQLVARP